jgi:hypothetical protein
MEWKFGDIRFLKSVGTAAFRAQKRSGDIGVELQFSNSRPTHRISEYRIIFWERAERLTDRYEKNHIVRRVLNCGRLELKDGLVNG